MSEKVETIETPEVEGEIHESPIKETAKIVKKAEKGGFMSFLKDFFEKLGSGEFFTSLLSIFGISKRETSKLKQEITGIPEFNNYVSSGHDKEALIKLAYEVAEKYDIPGKVFVKKLISHENGNWDPTIKNKTSSAFGLGQMISSTWERYGKGLDKNNPTHQLVAAAKYLKDIKEKNDCTWGEAVAFYNTGENFQKDSNSPVSISYIKGNLKSIVWKVPGCKGKTAEELDGKLSKKDYFEAAVEYYS